MAGAYPHKPGETVYYVRQHTYVFSVKKIDPATGKSVQKTNPATGQPLFLPNGDPEIIEKSYHFTPWKTRFTADGYVAVFVVDKNTDPLLSAALEEEAADRGSQVMTESEFIKSVNPELWEQMQEKSRVETLLGEKDKKNADLVDEVAKLRAQLSGRNK